MPLNNEDILYRLNQELQSMGLQYLGTDPNELAEIIKQQKVLREHYPPCYARSFDPTDELCQQCEINGECYNVCVSSRVDFKPFELIECNMCDGDLIIELFNDSGEVIDRACTTLGCRNTLNLQVRS